jgi:type VI secretion system protein ImpA
MASPETLPFERLLAPISEERPTGAELRQDREHRDAFFQLRDASKEARDAEKRALDYQMLSEEEREFESLPDAPDWRFILNSAIEVIADRSKDLWVTAWLIEALVRKEGFAGLRDGFRLARELCERYWDGIHPRPDEEDGEDITTTVSQLSSLNEILKGPIERVEITPETSSYPAFSSADYRDAMKTKGEITVTLDMFDGAAKEGKPEFFRNLMEDIEAAADEFVQLERVLDEKCGKDADNMPLAPATSNIKKVIGECRDRLRSFAKDILDVQQVQQEDSQERGAEGGELVAVNGQGQGGASAAEIAVRTREDAFRALMKVADFFKRTEPHSPISYKLEEAVRWGRLSLPELMEEIMSDLVSDESARHEMLRRAGIPQNKKQESSD